MKHLLFFLLLIIPARAADRGANATVLDDTAIQNLRLETVTVEEGAFEETVFALGRIGVYPGRRAVISSRVPGRAVEVFIKHDHPIEKGAVAVVVEGRQPGNPPPRIDLTAPIGGLVSRVEVAVGQPVEPSDALAEILDLREVYALARVPEHLAGRLRPGLSAHIRVPAFPGKTFTARLEHLGAEADAASGTVEAAFHVDNPDGILRPGLRAEFSIVLAKREGVMSVPRAALQGDAANRFVYVRDFDLPNAFLRTPVVVGEMNDQAVEIVSGLLPADEVVTRGAYALAFAGASSGMSLKEALDAAHGHEHNEDGSELTAEQRRARATPGPGASPGERPAARSTFWIWVSGALFVLLVVTNLRRRR